MSIRIPNPLRFAALAALIGLPVAAQLRYQPPVGASRWELGVISRNQMNSVMITHVARASVAQQVGLEVGDTILSVSGAPVGFVNGQLYDLADMLNQQADVYGRVYLQFRDGRTGRIRNIPVKLAPAADVLPPGPGPWPGPQPLPAPIPNPGFPPQNNAMLTVEGWYRKYMGRPSDPTGMAGWMQNISNGMRMGEVHANLLASGEFYDRCGHHPTNFVQAMYIQLVGRAATPEEQQRWVARLVREFRGNRMLFCRAFLQELGQY